MTRFSTTGQGFWKYFLLLTILLASTAGAAELDQYQAQAQKLLDKEQYKQAVQLWDKAANSVQEDTVRQQALIQQGDVYYYYLEDYRQALSSYQAAYNAAPQAKAAGNILYRRGLIYMDKLHEKDSAVKEFAIVLEEFPDHHKRTELKQLLKGTLSRAYKLKLVEQKNYWKFYICLIDGIIIFFWKVLHEYLSTTKFRKIMLDAMVTLLLIANGIIWWIVNHAQAQLDMLGLGIIK